MRNRWKFTLVFVAVAVLAGAAVAADRKLAEEMSSYWVNFARSGDPNSQGLPPWPAFTNVASKVRYLGDPITVGGVANIHGLSALDAVYSTVRGKPFATR